MEETVGLIATFRAAPGRLTDLLSELRTMVDTARLEEGTLAYGLHRMADDPDSVLVYEIYRDVEAQALHGLSDAIAALKNRLPALLAEPPVLTRLAPVAGAKGLPF
ncbi:MAG: putative quinol monooxygenase [Pseudomonadota bacterium]